MIRRGFWIYITVAVAWLGFIAWQGVEHRRVREAARQALMSRARDITSTLGLVIRSQRRGGGIISQERLESALAGLIKPGELNSIALLNAQNKVVVDAGVPLEESTVRVPSGVTWTRDTMMLANLMDLGTNAFPAVDGPRRAIVVQFGPPPGAGGSNAPPPPDRMRPPRGTNTADNVEGSPPPGGRSRGRPNFGRPPWMSEDEYQALIAKQGLHSFIIVMSTRAIQNAVRQDLWIRFIIALLATAAVGGSMVAWRNRERTADLEVRLVKASEMNSHLKQMNLAAAGLAHETRNPLNIIRGLAQIISRQAEAPPEVRDKSRAILEETDRVTAQLNEFINYSRPREVRRSPVAINHVVNDVARALTHDAEEKRIQLKMPADQLVIEADEQLLRQALFNLLLNAIQAVEEGGEIQVIAGKLNPSEAFLEVRDTGPGVPSANRAEIFKPYFTTNTEGTGLGLAVVRQIVLAHGWEIECLANEPRGAVFRVSRLRLAPA
jgi:signal transduction histidine kinase